MAFIRKTKSREGRHFLYLVEGYREDGKVKQRIVKNLGILEELEKDEPGVFERLKADAKAGKLTPSVSKEIVQTINLDEHIGLPPCNYGWKVLDSLFNSLGLKKPIQKFTKQHRFNFDLEKILKLVVFQRILNPKSKLGTVNSQNELFGDWHINEREMYKSLDYLNELKNSLQETLHKNISAHTNRTGTLVFYDVTNYYFEADLDDVEERNEDGDLTKRALRRRGPSKEKRPNPIVQMGLFMDSNGIPISYQLFEGNKVDPTTYIPAIEQVKKQFGIERIVTVADKAMNSQKNTSDAFSKGDGWLFSQKFRGKRGCSKEIQEFVLDEKGWLYNHERTFALKSYIRKRSLADKTVVKEKVLATWNKAYDVREKIRRDGAIEYAKKLTNAEKFQMTARKGGKKYLELFTIDEKTGEKKPFSPFIGIDYEQVDYDQQFDGINVLVTSEIDMTEDEMITHYRELSRIEDCFRVTKTDLQARPVYVWTEKHIEAHFFTCFIALTMLRIIQNHIDWSMSPAKIISALSSGVCEDRGKGIWEVWANDNLQNLHKELKIDFDKRYVKFEELNRYAAGWFTTK